MPADTRHRTTPSSSKPASVAALRRAFATAGYTFAAVREVLGADDTLTVLPQQVPLVHRQLGEGPLGTLIRLFLVGAPVTQEQAARALTPLPLQEAVNLGVVTLGRSRVHGAVRVLPTADVAGGLLFASDLDSIDPTDLPADFVMGVTESSRLLARLTVRRPVERALDLGTGCGYQAVCAAQHAQHVVATDVNPRAAAFARFNALLNGVENIDVRVGDGFAAVQGEMFDLVVCNPPFVISPDRAYTYRDSGLDGDAVSRDLVRQTPSFLRPDGIAHLLVSWIHTPDGDAWQIPLRAWVAESSAHPCDAWLFRKGSYDPLAYAVMWNQRLALANQMPKYIASVDRWTRYFEHLGAPALAYGAVWLRRRDTERPRVRADDLPEVALGADAADELVRLLHVDDRLEALSDAELLERVVRVPEDQRLEQVLRWSNGAFRTVDASLVRDGGLKPRADVDPPLAAVLARVDGTRTIDQVLEHAAHALGGNPEAITAQALPTVRELLSHGFLTLDGSDSA